MFKPKFPLPLYVSLILLAPIGARAGDSMPDLLKKVAELRDSADADIDFVYKRAPNCVSAGEKLEKTRFALLEAKKRIANYSKAVSSGFADLLDTSDGTCRAPSKDQVNAALESVKAVGNDIDDFFNKMAAKSGEAFYMYTYDELMMKALAATADGQFPKCVPANPADLNSTPESRRYLAFKDKLQQIGESVVKLRKLAKDKLKSGCKAAAAQGWRSASREEDDSGSAL